MACFAPGAGQAAWIAALRARVMQAGTPEELSALWQELEQLKFSSNAATCAVPAAYQMPTAYYDSSVHSCPWSGHVLTSTAFDAFPVEPTSVPAPPSLAMSKPYSMVGFQASRSTSSGSFALLSPLSTPRTNNNCGSCPTSPLQLPAQAECSTPTEWIGSPGASSIATCLSPARTTTAEKSTHSPTSPLSPQSPHAELFQSPTQFVVRNTFIEAMEERDPFIHERQVRSCPPTPTGLTDASDSLRVVRAAAELLAFHRAVASGPPAAAAEEGRPPLVSPVAAAAAEAEAPMVLRLSESLEELPSVGSALHSSGRCKPCAFVHSKGCASGQACQFCHLCDHGSSKRRKKAWREFLRSAYSQQQAQGQCQVAVGRHTILIPAAVVPR